MLADCRLQIWQHGSQVAWGQPCPECRWSIVRESAPCAERDRLENAAREAERAGRGSILLGALVARWRVEDHQQTCVTCQTVRLRLAIEDYPVWRCTCPALKRLYRAKNIYKRRIWCLIERAESGMAVREAEVQEAGG